MGEIVVAKHRSAGLPPEEEYKRIWSLANGVSTTEMVPTDMRGKGETVFATMLAGREIGLSPLESVRAFYVVDGKPTESAELLHTLALRAGHDVYIEKADREGAVVMARHRDWPEDRPHLPVVFDVEDAASAELVSYVCADSWPRHQTEQVQKNGRNGTYTKTMCKADDRGVRCKDNYRHYGRSMFRARAITEAVRTVCPDVTVGATYTAEELGAEVSGEHGTPPGRDEGQWAHPLDGDQPDEKEPAGDVVDAEVVGEGPEDYIPCQATPPGRDYPTCEEPEGHEGEHRAGNAKWRDPAPADPEPEGGEVVDICDVCGAPEVDGHECEPASQDTKEGGQAPTDVPGGDAAESGDGAGSHDAGRDDPEPAPRNDAPSSEAEPSGEGESVPSSPDSPNPCKTCGPEPRSMPCPDCPDVELPWQRADRLEISATDQMVKLKELSKELKATIPARRQYIGTGKCHPGLSAAFVAWLDEIEAGLSQPVGGGR